VRYLSGTMVSLMASHSNERELVAVRVSQLVLEGGEKTRKPKQDVVASLTIPPFSGDSVLYLP